MSKIAKAQRVRDLIEHPEFKDAIAVLRTGNIEKWQKSNIHDKEAQTECKYFEKALNDLLRQFKRVIEDGVMEEETNRRNQERKNRGK